MSLESLQSELMVKRRLLPSRALLHTRRTPIEGFNSEQLQGAVATVSALYRNHDIPITNYAHIDEAMRPFVSAIFKKSGSPRVALDYEEEDLLAQGWSFLDEVKTSSTYSDSAHVLATAIEYAIALQVQKTLGHTGVPAR